MMLWAACGLVYGVLAALVFRRFTDSVRLRQATAQLIARILEFRLFIDEPALIWRAQKAAFRANLEILRAIVWPCVPMAVLFALVYAPLDRVLGHAPLRIGDSAVLTLRADATPNIPGLMAETPGVRIPRTGEVSWRVRATGNIPQGTPLNYPASETWLIGFFACSCVGSVVAAVLIPSRQTI